MDDATVAPAGEGVHDDDALSARLRTSIDGDAAPVTLAEVRDRVDGGATAAAGAPLAVVGRGADEGDDEDGGSVANPEPTSNRSAARRGPIVWLAAAAAIVLVVGIGAFAASRPPSESSDDVDVVSGPGTTTVPTTPPTSMALGGPAPGGLYDPATTLLADRTVVAMANDGAGRIYVSYARSRPDGAPAHGLLVAEAGDGAVRADHELPGSPVALATSGTTLWAMTGALPSYELWRSVEGGEPERMDALPSTDLVPAIAASTDGVWVRSLGRLQQRDPVSGMVVDESTDPAYDSVGAIAVDGDHGWTVAAGPLSGPPSSTVVPFDGVTPGPVVGGEPIEVLAMVDGTLFAGSGSGDGPAHLITVSESGAATTVVERDQGFQDIDGRDGRAWAVANDLASSSRIDVITFDVADPGGPAASRWLEPGFEGIAPTVVGIDAQHALVCAMTLPAIDAPIQGSACRLLDAAATPDPVSTTGPETATTTVVPPSSTTLPVTTTTATTVAPPAFPDVPVTTTTIVARPLHAAGISGRGLDPIELNMDQDRMLAATSEPLRRANPECGHEVYLDGSGGVEVHLYPLVEGDGSSGRRFIVGAVAVSSPAFSTAAGARVGMTTAQLEASTPGLEHGSLPATVGGPKVAGQYVQRTGQGTIRFNHGDGVVNEIVVTSSSGGFFTDLC